MLFTPSEFFFFPFRFCPPSRVPGKACCRFYFHQCCLCWKESARGQIQMASLPSTNSYYYYSLASMYEFFAAWNARDFMHLYIRMHNKLSHIHFLACTACFCKWSWGILAGSADERGWLTKILQSTPKCTISATIAYTKNTNVRRPGPGPPISRSAKITCFACKNASKQTLSLRS